MLTISHPAYCINSVTYCINSADAMKRQEMCLEFIWKGTVKAKGSGIFGGKKKDLMEEPPLHGSSQTKTPQDEKEETHSEECLAKEHSTFLKKKKPTTKPTQTKRLLAENLPL